MFRSSKTTRTFAIGLLVVGLAGGAACSSDGSDGGSDKPTTTTQGNETDKSAETVVDPETTDGTGVDDVDPTTTTPDAEGPSDNEQDYVDGLAEAISDGALIDDEQGACLGETWVDMIGFDNIAATDMSPSEFANLDSAGYDKLDLSEAEADALYDAFGSCDIDVVKTIRSGFQEGATPEQEACLDSTLTEDAVKNVFTQGLLGDSQDIDPVQTAVQDCLAA